MPRTPWIPRVLFWLVCTVAVGLLGLLIAAPWLDSQDRLLRLFAQDAPLRRTAFASALGLIVTACVFFRARGPRDEPPRPSGPVGA